MKLTVEILAGAGRTEGAGVYEAGTPVSIILFPDPGQELKTLSVKKGSGESMEVPISELLVFAESLGKPYAYEFITDDEDVSFFVSFYVSIESYLQTKAPFDVSRFLQGIRTDRNIPYGADISEVAEQDKKLCEADLYMCLSTLPTSRTAARETDASWSSQGEGITVSQSDKTAYISRAMTIYKKYDPEKYEEVEQSLQYKKTIVEYSYSRPNDSKIITATLM